MDEVLSLSADLSKLGHFDGTNVYMGIKHIPRVDDPLFYHPPPPAVAKVLKCLSCADVCLQCMAGDHNACPHCVLHIDRADASISVLYMWQQTRSSKARSAFFCLGDRCFDLHGSLVTAFRGDSTLHGIWQAEGVRDNDLLGCVMVKKKRLLRS